MADVTEIGAAVIAIVCSFCSFYIGRAWHSYTIRRKLRSEDGLIPHIHSLENNKIITHDTSERLIDKILDTYLW